MRHLLITTTLTIFALVSLSGCGGVNRSILTAYAAKVVGSAVYVGQRPKDTALREEMFLGRQLHHFIKMQYEPPPEEEPEWAIITARGFGGSFVRSAFYKRGRGVTLLPKGVVVEDFTFNEPFERPKAPQVKTLPSATLSPRQSKEIEGFLDWAFAESQGNFTRKRTRAVLVLKDDKVIAERYAPGFSASTRFMSWSMAKSFLNALVGILVNKGEMKIHDKLSADEWSDSEEKKEITVDQLLHMTSGLKFRSSIKIATDESKMLFLAKDMANYAASQALEKEPGTRWLYSSGNSLILSRHIKKILGKEEYLDFIYRELLFKIGMSSAVVETDLTGTWVASSYLYATARDFARFGQVYLHNGVHNGERLFPSWWIPYTEEALSLSNKAGYGAHFYSNDHNIWKDLPTDTLMAKGFLGQLIAIIPSKGIVAVRLGNTVFARDWSPVKFLKELLRVLPEDSSEGFVKDESREFKHKLGKEKKRLRKIWSNYIQRPVDEF